MPQELTRVEAEFRCNQAEGILKHPSKESTDRAIVLYSEAVELDPTFAPAAAGLSSAYSEAMTRYGHPRTLVDEAIALARKSIELDPFLAAGHNALAAAYFAKGDLRGSLEAGHKLYGIDQRNGEAVADIAFLHLDLGELEEAIHWHQIALDKVPGASFEGAYVRRNLARLHMMFLQYAKAQEWLNGCLAIEPDFPGARILLIYLHLVRGERMQAFAEAESMLARKPEDPATLNYAADVALIEGDLEKGRKLLEKAIEIGPDSRNFYRSRRAKTALAFVLWKQGDRNSATRIFEERMAIRKVEFDGGLNCWGPPYELAAIQSTRGNKKDSLGWLERAVEMGWREPQLGRNDPLLENLWGEPGFEGILWKLQERIEHTKSRPPG